MADISISNGKGVNTALKIYEWIDDMLKSFGIIGGGLAASVADWIFGAVQWAFSCRATRNSTAQLLQCLLIQPELGRRAELATINTSGLAEGLGEDLGLMRELIEIYCRQSFPGEQPQR